MSQESFGRKSRKWKGSRSMRERVSLDNVVEKLTIPAQFFAPFKPLFSTFIFYTSSPSNTFYPLHSWPIFIHGMVEWPIFPLWLKCAPVGWGHWDDAYQRAFRESAIWWMSQSTTWPSRPWERLSDTVSTCRSFAFVVFFSLLKSSRIQHHTDTLERNIIQLLKWTQSRLF